MRSIKNNQGFVFIASVMLVLFLSILLGGAFLRSQMQLEESKQRLASQQAFYAAETGVQVAIYRIRQQPAWRPGENGEPAVSDSPLRVVQSDPATTIGFYSLQLATAPDFNVFQSVRVKSTGKDKDGKITRSILARVIISNPADFFVSTVGNLRIGSGSSFDEAILGKDIFFDVNNGLPPSPPQITVQDVFYLNSVSGIPDPSVKVNGQVKQFPTVTFAGVDLDRYRAIAQANGRYFSGDKFVYSGDIDLPSLNSSNGLVFAEGDIYISGDIKDSMLFVAGGNIYIENDVKTATASTDTERAALPQLGLLAKKDVIIPQNAASDITIDAFIMADGGDNSRGGIFVADGDKFSKNTINFSGAIAVRGDNVRTAADLNVYQTRNYSYNSQLRTNRKIPFLPFIANIVRWQEINPGDLIPQT